MCSLSSTFWLKRFGKDRARRVFILPCAAISFVVFSGRGIAHRVRSTFLGFRSNSFFWVSTSTALVVPLKARGLRKNTVHLPLSLHTAWKAAAVRRSVCLQRLFPIRKSNGNRVQLAGYSRAPDILRHYIHATYCLWCYLLKGVLPR